jgi:ankyrin repeat protein
MDKTKYNELIARGGVLLNREEYDSALKAFNEAIEFDSEDATGFVGRGIVYTLIKDVDSAVADFDTALQLDPYSIESWQRSWYPCLHYVTQGDNLEVFKYLVEKDANIFGVTSIFYGVRSGLEVFKYLIDKGADIDIESMTLLFEAARSGNLELVKYLVDKGADVNNVGRFGETPLFGAALSGNLEVIK